VLTCADVIKLRTVACCKNCSRQPGLTHLITLAYVRCTSGLRALYVRTTCSLRS